MLLDAVSSKRLEITGVQLRLVSFSFASWNFDRFFKCFNYVFPVEGENLLILSNFSTKNTLQLHCLEFFFSSMLLNSSLNTHDGKSQLSFSMSASRRKLQSTVNISCFITWPYYSSYTILVLCSFFVMCYGLKCIRLEWTQSLSFSAFYTPHNFIFFQFEVF